MIIWIPSYPKSGNTWVRALISSYLYTQEGTFCFNDLGNIDQFPSKKYLSYFLQDFSNPAAVSKYWIEAQKKINEKNTTTIFKTHNQMCTINGYSFTNKKHTAACIYVIRDPRNVITSLANHYLLTIEQAYNFFTNKRKIIFTKSDMANGTQLEEKANAHFIGSWREHYLSWKNIGFAPVKIVRYEDLVKNINDTFFSILVFLNKHIKFKFNEKKMLSAIKSCNFEVLKKMENQEGFPEASKIEENGKEITFFNLGEKNNWQKILDPIFEEKIRKNFYNEMKELEYL